MEIFVSARVGLATLGGVRIAFDLGLHSTLFYFYPSLVCETLEGEILPWRYVCCLAEFEFLRRRGDSKSQEVTRLWICGRSVSVLPDFSRF